MIAQEQRQDPLRTVIFPPFDLAPHRKVILREP
jgi:hypothetical protein